MQFLVKLEDGSTVGPVSAVELADMAASGKVTPACFVQRDGGSGAWHPASRVKGLAFGGGRPSPPLAETHTATAAAVTAPTTPGASPPPPALPAEMVGAKVAQVAVSVANVVSPELAKSVANAMPEDLAKSIRHALPILITRPTEGVAMVYDLYPQRVLVGFGIAINALGNLVIALVIGLFTTKLPLLDQLGLVLKAAVSLAVPFFALALSNLGMRRIVVPESKRTFGYDAIVAATALLPLQIAGIAMSFSSNELTLAGIIFGLLITTVLIFALNVADSPAKLNALLFASPVQMMVAVYLASLMFRELMGIRLFGALLPQVPGAG